MPDITSANVVFLLEVPSLITVPVQIQGFAADDIFDFDEVDATDTMMGADGLYSGGMVFAEKPQRITLQADSPSIDVFNTWYLGQQSALLSYPAVGTVTFTSIGTTWALGTGFLKRWRPVPPAKKILQPISFTINWGSVIPAPVGAAG